MVPLKHMREIEKSFFLDISWSALLSHLINSKEVAIESMSDEQKAVTQTRPTYKGI